MPAIIKEAPRRVKNSADIRTEFLEFFRDKDHAIVASAPLVPHEDPTLLFTNAGMNQFKDVFLGTGTREYRRAADTQKCLRVSGKHNDLEEVGIDTYHHTFFEMLGNWSFGDYFKREAIAWAWELLVDKWGLDPKRIYVTVHAGDDQLGLGPDEEAADLWRSETGVTPEHVLYFGSKDNFWMMGDTGPCGPCSEIHYDLRTDAQRAAQPGAELVNADDPRVMEIWNLVFIQYNAQPDGSLNKLAAQHVDTGMGFERIVAVLQNKKSNYDSDLFAPILERVAQLSPRDDVTDYALDDVGDEELRSQLRIAMRVIADHIRTIVFAISDGVIPGNTGRGYVIRRILRRAVRFGYQTLGFRSAFLHLLVPLVVDEMSTAFPELKENQEYIARVTSAEENGFLETLGHGIRLFETIVPYVERAGRGGADRVQAAVDLRDDRKALEILEKSDAEGHDEAVLIDTFIRDAGANRLPGTVVFLLHDTYGFPADLTALMARERGIGIDIEGYESCMQAQRSRARSAASFATEIGQEWEIVTSGADSEFVGYDTANLETATVRAVRAVAGESDDHEGFEIVLDRTPFYAESGGQVGDKGFLSVAGEDVRVLDTYRQDGRIVHRVSKLPHDLTGTVSARVDAASRMETAKHHSATHLLHAALREVLGRHVSQKGSLVAPDRLRFDFSHFERVTESELEAIAARVNEMIQRNISREEERSVPVDEALGRGAMALFGEKYGDSVRVITFDPTYSIELCGGIHVEATGELGVFRFTSEGSVASGIRRVEAVVGKSALAHIDAELNTLDAVRSQFKTLQRPVAAEVESLVSRARDLEKEIALLRVASLGQVLDALVRDAVEANGVRVVAGKTAPAVMDDLRILGQDLRGRLGSGAVGVLGAVDPGGDKVYLVSTVTDDLVGKGLSAGKLVGAVAKTVGGGGGGRPELATAGGKLPDKLDEALKLVPGMVETMLSN